MSLRKTLLLLPLALGSTAIAGCATIAGAVGETYQTAMVGAQEVPGPGDPDGTGTVKITADSATNTVCVDMTVRDIATPTMAHIHTGARGVAGPVLIALPVPTNGVAKQCLDVEKSIAAGIIANPAGYYVNVHNADYPSGAIRGQLAAR